ncbi:MAG: type III pantothenate kinase [Candidatus Melainabacteria bacterium]|nr:type III pantothenate kinase [Candidatus Melainabacteria bacterium]
MSRILAVDAGNTRVKCAVVEDGAVLEQWSFLTRHVRSKVRGALSRVDLPVVLASVVPAVTKAVSAWCESSGRELFVITSKNQTLLKANDELGADLLAAAAAAFKLHAKGRPVAVIGLGTAITLTAIAGDGTFRGALFTLGMKQTRDTLAARCALLDHAATTAPSSVLLGNDTRSCMDNGVLLATVGIARAYADQARRELGSDALIVATGGDSALVAPLANAYQRRKAINIVDNELTLKGIYLLAGERRCSSC